jgi:Tfp pilus assembly protein PilN
MKAVNLLPEKHRPRKPSGGQGKGGYVVLGVLGAVLVGVLVYVLTLNTINDSKSKIKDATAAAARLNEEANSLGPYGDFAKIKADRVQSVMTLAQGRFDYERLVRELAQVLPPDVWLVNASASATGDSSSTTTSTPAPAPPTGGSGSTTGTSATPGAASTPAAPAGPTLKLDGCARDQSQVAVTLVRLRELQGATDVSLDHSTRGQDTPGAAPAAPGASSGSSGGDAGCGTTNGKPNYSFEANVTFEAPSASQPTTAPNRLGGGA